MAQASRRCLFYWFQKAEPSPCPLPFDRLCTKTEFFGRDGAPAASQPPFSGRKIGQIRLWNISVAPLDAARTARARDPYPFLCKAHSTGEGEVVPTLSRRCRWKSYITSRSHRRGRPCHYAERQNSPITGEFCRGLVVGKIGWGRASSKIIQNSLFLTVFRQPGKKQLPWHIRC